MAFVLPKLNRQLQYCNYLFAVHDTIFITAKHHVGCCPISVYFCVVWILLNRTVVESQSLLVITTTITRIALR